MTDWITPEGTEPPLLAPAALVVILAEERRGLITPTGPWRADNVTWRAGLEYRPLTDEEGYKLISAGGLEEWARWVTTDEDGTVIQWAEAVRPYRFKSGRWLVGVGMPCFCEEAPSSHHHPGDPRDSLYRVEGR